MENYLDYINENNMSKSEALRYLRSKLSMLHGSWDSIVEKDGTYYFYDYERKHRSREEFGDELTEDEKLKYLSLTYIINSFDSGLLHPSNVKWELKEE